MRFTKSLWKVLVKPVPVLTRTTRRRSRHILRTRVLGIKGLILCTILLWTNRLRPSPPVAFRPRHSSCLRPDPKTTIRPLPLFLGVLRNLTMNDRPSIKDSLQSSEAVSNFPGPPSPGADGKTEDGDDWDSAISSSGIPRAEWSADTSPGLGYLANRTPSPVLTASSLSTVKATSEADANGLGRRAIDLDISISRINSSHGDVHQVGTI